jgi:hypothetical protein
MALQDNFPYISYFTYVFIVSGEIFVEKRYDQDELTEKKRLAFGLLEVSGDHFFAIDGSQRK